MHFDAEHFPKENVRVRCQNAFWHQMHLYILFAEHFPLENVR